MNKRLNLDPTTRFSNRVDNYVKYRPSYPSDLIDLLAASVEDRMDRIAVDVGAGPGQFSKLLVERGFSVYAVEPNEAMRLAGVELLGNRPGFTSIAGSAERTTLRDHFADLVTAAQAYHWFDISKAATEFARILRQDGRIALIWNNRKPDATPFLAAYDDLLNRSAPDYKAVNHMRLGDDDILAAFRPGAVQKHSFPYSQKFDWDGLLGRANSSSYVPPPGTPENRRFERDLRFLFEQFNADGFVAFDYETVCWLGEPIT